MTEPTSRHSHAFAFVMITSLFFMWGFVHNLDPILIPHLRHAFSLSGCHHIYWSIGPCLN